MRRVPFALLLGLLSSAAPALPTDATRSLIPFEQTDAWAMAYVAASTLFTGYGPSPELESGAIAAGAELGHVPRLDEDELRVGLGGVKREDLNKSPLVGRAHLWLGLPRQFVFELGWVPPLQINGARAHGLVSAALARRWWTHERWSLSTRVHAQTGAAVADVTCPADIAGSTDPVRNPYDCLTSSRDRISLGQYGFDTTLGMDWRDDWRVHATLGLLRLEPETRIRAEHRSYHNRSALVSHGTRPYWTLGFGRDIGHWRSAAELLYVPLRIRRPGRDAETEPYWSFRLMLSRDLRAD